jgi:hypothetical protein
MHLVRWETGLVAHVLVVVEVCMKTRRGVGGENTGEEKEDGEKGSEFQRA